MAEKLNEFNFTRARNRYDWDRLFDGNVWELKEGQDFTTDVKTIRSSVYAAARRHDVQVRTQVEGDNLVLQAVREDTGNEDSE